MSAGNELEMMSLIQTIQARLDLGSGQMELTHQLLHRWRNSAAEAVLEHRQANASVAVARGSHGADGNADAVLILLDPGSAIAR